MYLPPQKYKKNEILDETINKFINKIWQGQGLHEKDGFINSTVMAVWLWWLHFQILGKIFELHIII